jgi:hypothetical protein
MEKNVIKPSSSSSSSPYKKKIKKTQKRKNPLQKRYKGGDELYGTYPPQNYNNKKFTDTPYVIAKQNEKEKPFFYDVFDNKKSNSEYTENQLKAAKQNEEIRSKKKQTINHEKDKTEYEENLKKHFFLNKTRKKYIQQEEPEQEPGPPQDTSYDEKTIINNLKNDFSTNIKILKDDNKYNIENLNKELENQQQQKYKHSINFYKNYKSIENTSWYISLIWLPIIIESAENELKKKNKTYISKETIKKYLKNYRSSTNQINQIGGNYDNNYKDIYDDYGKIETLLTDKKKNNENYNNSSGTSQNQGTKKSFFEKLYDYLTRKPNNEELKKWIENNKDKHMVLNNDREENTLKNYEENLNSIFSNLSNETREPITTNKQLQTKQEQKSTEEEQLDYFFKIIEINLYNVLNINNKNTKIIEYDEEKNNNYKTIKYLIAQNLLLPQIRTQIFDFFANNNNNRTGGKTIKITHKMRRKRKTKSNHHKKHKQ